MKNNKVEIAEPKQMKDFFCVHKDNHSSRINVFADNSDDAYHKLSFIVKYPYEWNIVEKKSFEELNEEYQIEYAGMWENDLSKDSIISEWTGVSNDDGIAAYFHNERDALLFREQKILDVLKSFD